MDLPAEFFEDIPGDLYKVYVTWRNTTSIANRYLKNFVNKYIADRTMNEVIGFLNYLAKMAE